MRNSILFPLFSALKGTVAPDKIGLKVVPMVEYALVGIRFVDGKKIFECCLHFFIIIYVVPAVLQLARICMQFADSAGNIVAFSFRIFRTFLLFS
jgi:hypothetical protein